MQLIDKNIKKRNILINLSYNGSQYHGWQVQNNALCVQEVFQNALWKVLKETVNIKGCSRTDACVHANMYAVSFKTTSHIKEINLVYALNRILPNNISVNSAMEVSEDFDARYSCKGKEYIYKIWNHRIKNPFIYNYALHYWYKLDVNFLNEVSQLFVGRHDFTSFATIDKRKQTNMIRKIYNFNVNKNGSMIEIVVSADGFLYNMVRILVGTLLRVAQGKIKKNDIPIIIEMKNRKYAGPTAPAHGLYLNKVFYDLGGAWENGP